MKANDRNVETLLRLREGKDPAEPQPEDDMRIDSDNVTNHYHVQKEGMSALAKLIALAVCVGLPAAGIAWNLPGIISAVKGVKDVVTQPAEPPKEDSGNPSINIGGQEYELRLGEPDK